MQPRLYWKLQMYLEVFSVPRFDGVVCITNYTQENISDLARSTWVVPNAVDKTFFDIRPEPVKPVRILVVAHIQPRKNQVFFIDSLAPLQAELGFEIRFFGRGSPADEFGQEFFRRVDQYDWCYFGGMLGREELKKEFEQASLLVLPSLEDNCPMSVLEAMASGVPVVASNVGGVPDLVKDGVNGVLCEPTTAESIQSAVSGILRHPDVAIKLATQAGQWAADSYHPSVIARRHLEVYEEVVKEKAEMLKSGNLKAET
jgi:glycosyltransferase involved in cell wall biosynthesis